MIKIINEIDGKKYELVPSDKGCIECDLEKMCYGAENKKNVVWDTTLPCSRLFGVWEEVKDGTGENKSEVMTKYHIVQQVMRGDKKVWILLGVEYDNLQFALKDLDVHRSVIPNNVYRLAKKTETEWKVMNDED